MRPSTPPPLDLTTTLKLSNDLTTGQLLSNCTVPRREVIRTRDWWLKLRFASGLVPLAGLGRGNRVLSLPVRQGSLRLAGKLSVCIREFLTETGDSRPFFFSPGDSMDIVMLNRYRTMATTGIPAATKHMAIQN